jgi:purine-cytosine permease-like protein
MANSLPGHPQEWKPGGTTMTKSPNRLLGLVLGVVYLLIGILGFFLTSDTGFSATTGPKFIDLFEVNPLHNLVHLIVGIALFVTALVGVRAARTTNMTLGAIFLLVGVVGLLLASPDNALNILAINGADNVLNFATAVVLLCVSFGADKPVADAKTA